MGCTAALIWEAGAALATTVACPHYQRTGRVTPAQTAGRRLSTATLHAGLQADDKLRGGVHSGFPQSCSAAPLLEGTPSTCGHFASSGLRRCPARSRLSNLESLVPIDLKGGLSLRRRGQGRGPLLRKNASIDPGGRRRNWRVHAAARDSDGKSYYELLGVPESADDKEIKKAYRRMALKYHPDVNKEKNAEAVFVKIKQAYTTLSDSKSRSQYDSELRGGAWGFPSGGATDWDPLDPFGYKKKRTTGGKQEEEEFYGLGDFFRDLQKEVEGWQSDRGSSEAPKSLWEEMAEVGEEFVEFLEQELGLDEKESKKRTEQRKSSPSADGTGAPRTESSRDQQKPESSKREDGPGTGGRRNEKDHKKKGDDIEELLASLKKEMGL
ncbi:chaperone DnaJ-domain superfamily protein [Klebsormidium nitens]|uniref:Chaperone DnaJ-domain superfamily protein n=1 Tax=Klebsormidium nitens TaxID=105231 RepID=A0A1Y1I3U0_KLENI|nr:chaperone DnaJ-domain superfamily protein [Klebsormidium nitens]|eukprot:GAQ84079.1 chaperone DnaJ-domain superfamily protein [Klebsormidium nitens]